MLGRCLYLTIRASQLGDPKEFLQRAPDPPDAGTVLAAERALADLGALATTGRANKYPKSTGAAYGAARARRPRVHDIGLINAAEVDMVQMFRCWRFVRVADVDVLQTWMGPSGVLQGPSRLAASGTMLDNTHQSEDGLSVLGFL